MNWNAHWALAKGDIYAAAVAAPMATQASGAPGRVAADGSPYPDRTRPTFERDVQLMFTYIAQRYDWFDHVASLGNDFLWRPRALWQLDRFSSDRAVHRILDIGCGTGDLTRLAARHFPGARVIGADFTAAMLAKADLRIGSPPERARIDLERASALHLPYRTATFDLAMSAFVARNLPDLAAAFRELRRVLRPGGVLMTLEITEPTEPWFRGLFHAYFDRVVPWLGAAVRSAGPYRYLPESLKTLPAREEMLDLFRVAGFSRSEAYPQSMGIVTTFLAEARH
jgi:demethylmenaquinone methyltransferase / 2-methoxy-6-polyprenyl-1,4-benzoquinol methylase